MAINENVSNPNLRNQEKPENTPERQPERRQRRTEQNNNLALLACVPLLSGIGRNSTVVVNQETQVRDFSTNFIASSIQTYSTSASTVQPGEDVLFDSVATNTGVSFSFSNNQTTIIAPGVYLISFSANISGTANNQTANFAIAVDNVPNTTSQIVQTVDQNQTYNIKTQLVIKLTEQATISVTNNGSDAISVANANLAIIKTSNF